MKAPFFIIGTERSGSNLLRMILDSSDEVCVPHPPHFLKNLHGMAKRYGDLEEERNFRSLIKDVLLYLKLHPYPWDLVTNVDEVRQNAPFKSLLGIHCALYNLKSRAAGKQFWGCKSTFSVRHVHEIAFALPQAKFLHLVRDPRDVAVSALKSQFNHFHPYFIAKLWQEEQILARTCAQNYPERTLVVKYEELVSASEEVVKRICRFLDIPFAAQMLRYYEGAEARKSMALSESWRNTGQPILTQNFDKYKKILSAADVAVIEAMCYPEMESFGYELQHALSDLETLRLRLFKKVPLTYWPLEKLRMVRKQISLFKSDQNNGKRILKFWYVKWLQLRR